MSEAIPSLESYQQLPDEGDAVFSIGDSLVRFTARHEHGRVSGWTVTTADEGYEGFLEDTRTTTWTETGPEPMRTYSFRYRGPHGGRQFMNAGPTDVSVDEFKSIYFGDRNRTEHGTN
ncbi:hypothetical protein [Microbacterium aerolatum]|uniref:hypothetical protein n=1 Tax=Microbacterium aerolatum TaxID=153731 RepID=UPI003851053D